MFYQHTKFVFVHFVHKCKSSVTYTTVAFQFMFWLTWKLDTCHLKVSSFGKRSGFDITNAICELVPGLIERCVIFSHGTHNIFRIQTGEKSRIACLRVERHATNCASATKSGDMLIPPASTDKMFISPDTWLPTANYALARNATFSINLDTKRRVYLERHGGDVTRVNTALATLGLVHFTLFTIATMPPLIHNVLVCPNGRIKSHCIFARRAACSQWRLGDETGRHVHTARFNGQNVHIARHLTAHG